MNSEKCILISFYQITVWGLSARANSILNLLDTKEISSKMKSNITKLYEAFGMEKIFGRSDVIEVLGITERPASTLLGKMYSLGLTEKIIGAGKGKYRFIV